MGSLRLPSRLATTLYRWAPGFWPGRPCALPPMSRCQCERQSLFWWHGLGARRSLVFNGLDNDTSRSQTSIADASHARGWASARTSRRDLRRPVCAQEGTAVDARLASVHRMSSGCSPGGGPAIPLSGALAMCCSRPTVAAGSCTGAGKPRTCWFCPAWARDFRSLLQEALACGTAVFSTDEIVSAWLKKCRY